MFFTNMDIVTRETRSKMMASVRSKDTKPEKKVRSLLHALGYRFRIHRKDLPGNPDIVLVRHKKVIFVHGCFWHQHPGCPKSRRPSSNTEYWNRKLDENIERDRLKSDELKRSGWRVLVVWQCETKNLKNLATTLNQFLDV